MEDRNQFTTTVARNRNILSGILSGLKVPEYIQTISDIGIDFSVVGKSKSLTRKITESEDDIYQSLTSQSGVQILDETPYSDKKYKDKVEFIRRLTGHPEIESIVHNFADELVEYDKYGYFCQLDLSQTQLTDEVKRTVQQKFKRIYNMLSFDDGITAWSLAVKWANEGYMAIEIIYDDVNNPKNIVGFEFMDPTLLQPINKQVEYTKNGKKLVKTEKMWVYTRTATNKQVTLSDNQVIFIAFNRVPGNRQRLSYTERLLRSFNLMRTLENSTVAWWVLNAQWRLKIIVPQGLRTQGKAKQSIQMFADRMKEDLLINNDSGEVTVYGQSRLNYGRNIVLPSRGQGMSPTVEGIAYEGPDLSGMEGVKYFEKKLWRDSKQPWTRFDKENTRGTLVMFGQDGIPYDEVSWYKFKNRCRREFETIIKKPLYLQLLLDFPVLRYKPSIYAELGLSYADDEIYHDARKYESSSIKMKFINDLDDKQDVNGEELFSKKFLYVHKYKLMSEEEWQINKKLKEEENASSEEDLNRDMDFPIPDDIDDDGSGGSEEDEFTLDDDQ